MERVCNYSGGCNYISPGFSNSDLAFQNDVIFTRNRLVGPLLH